MTFPIKAYLGRHRSGVVLISGEDVDQMINEMLTTDWDDSVAALYLHDRPLNPAGVPDHEMLVAVNHEDKVGSLQYFGPDHDHAATSLGAGLSDDELSYQYMGNERVFPARSEIPLPVIVSAVKEFMATGVRPTCVEWQPYLADA